MCLPLMRAALRPFLCRFKRVAVFRRIGFAPQVCNFTDLCHLQHAADLKGSDMSRGNISLAAMLWLVIAFFIVYPVSILLLESFKIAETGGWGVTNYLRFFQETYYLKNRFVIFKMNIVKLDMRLFVQPHMCHGRFIRHPSIFPVRLLFWSLDLYWKY